ncbi:Synaptonemal Complex Central Element Protein 3 [Manis pentadactyla]|nr:Synaptonemal Complex Central Element Protein 3 [Manis pentadactyla]
MFSCDAVTEISSGQPSNCQNDCKYEAWLRVRKKPPETRFGRGRNLERGGGAGSRLNRGSGWTRVRAEREMADSDPGERNYDNMPKTLSDPNKDLEKLLEEMEKVSVQATWMAYDMVVMRTNPALAESVRRLEDAFLNCKEEMEKNWQELLRETRRKQ